MDADASTTLITESTTGDYFTIMYRPQGWSAVTYTPRHMIPKIRSAFSKPSETISAESLAKSVTQNGTAAPACADTPDSFMSETTIHGTLQTDSGMYTKGRRV